MKSMAIVTKKSQPQAWNTGRDLQAWLKDRGVAAYHVENEPDPLVPPQLPAEIELIAVIGGDGTLLSVVRHYGQKDIPILGVNVGGLGFLTEISLDELYPCMENHILTGQCDVEKRMMLTTTLFRGDDAVLQADVLNDAVIKKGALATIAELTAWIDGDYLTTYRADGLIVSTPTGSTAYNLSAGGPIIFPTLSHFILLPICPHTLSNRPLILPEGSTVAITFDEHKGQDLYLTLDGQLGQPLKPGDWVEIRRSPHQVNLVISPYRSYFEILCNKLGWGRLGGKCPPPRHFKSLG
jgi:NAD+ kinase